MPIAPEHRWYYPMDWRELSRVILFTRAKGRCEHCGRPPGQEVMHLNDGIWWDAERGIWRDGRGKRVRKLPLPHVFKAGQLQPNLLGAKHRSTRKDGRVLSTPVILQATSRHSRQHGQGEAILCPASAKARRNAAMVAFLAVLPIRRRAFCELELRRSLLREGQQTIVRLEPELTKTAQP